MKRVKRVGVKLSKEILTCLVLLATLTIYIHPVEAAVENTENLTSPIGTNLHFFTYHSPDWVFVDVFPKTQEFTKMRCSGGGWNEGPDLATDSNGWITSLQDDQCAGFYLFWLSEGAQAQYPAGEYTLLWEGDGSFQISGDAHFTHNQGESVDQSNGLNKVTFQVTPSTSNDGLFFRISSVASDYLRNMRLIMPGGVCGQEQDMNNLDYFSHCETTRGGSGTCGTGEICYDFEEVYWDRFRDSDNAMNNPGVVFHPEYLERLRKYKVLRATFWMAVHNNPLQNWSDRAGLQKQTFADNGGSYSLEANSGVPYEIYIALGNILNADLWLNIPYETTNDFNTQFANLVLNKLNTNLKVYLEYGNEHWNPSDYFVSGWNYLLDKANEPGSGIDSNADDGVKVARYYSQRAGEIHAIWRNAFSDSESRIIRVLGGHTASPEHTREVLDWQMAYQNADTLAIHGYFAGELFNANNEAAILSMSVDDIFNEINNGGLGSESSLDRTNSHYNTNYSLADERGLDLIAYEGGQYLVADIFSSVNQTAIYNLFLEANRDSRMGDATLTNFNNFRNAGGKTFLHFSNTSWYSVYGTNGALEYQTQPRSDSPRYDAIMTFIEQNDCWWNNCEGTTGETPVSYYSLLIEKEGTGMGTVTSSLEGIDCGNDCRETYLGDTIVTLTAAPSESSLFTGWSGGGCSGTGECIVTLNASTTVEATFERPFVIAQGRNLIDNINNQIIWLRGVNVDAQWVVVDSTGEWTLDDDFTGTATPAIELYSDMVTEADFAAIREMGMNTVRLNLNYQIFEERDTPYVYRQEGWNFLDQVIEQARNNDLYLTLSMVTPQGGYQPCWGCGAEFWDDQQNSERFVALWREIAGRYVNEPVISGYDLLNEPNPTYNVQQWQDIAQQTIDAIRTVDNRHLVVVEAVNWIVDANGSSPWPVDESTFQFPVNDSNVMYDFHFYEPMDFTHQQVPWAGYPEPAAYPDQTVIYFPDDLQWSDSENTTAIPSGTSDWQPYESGMYRIDTDVVAAYPSLYCWNNTGTVYYDDLVINEYDENNVFVREVMNLDFSSSEEWSHWGDGEFIRSTQGRNDNASLAMQGTTNGSWYNNDLRFQVHRDYSYRINGYMSGEDIGDGAWCVMNITFESSSSQTPVLLRDREYVEYHLLQRAQFGIENNVPVNVGEFGPSRESYGDGLGGMTYLEDVLDLMVSNNLHFTYYTYNNWNEGYEGEYAPVPGLYDFLRNYYLTINQTP